MDGARARACAHGCHEKRAVWGGKWNVEQRAWKALGGRRLSVPPLSKVKTLKSLCSIVHPIGQHATEHLVGKVQSSEHCPPRHCPYSHCSSPLPCPTTSAPCSPSTWCSTTAMQVGLPQGVPAAADGINSTALTCTAGWTGSGAERPTDRERGEVCSHVHRSVERPQSCSACRGECRQRKRGMAFPRIHHTGFCQ